MSFRATQLCRPLRLTPPQKAVLMCLADFCHEDGKDWHSLASIQEWTCLSRSTVIEALKYLESEGLLRIERVPGRKSTSFLQLAALKARAEEANARPLEGGGQKEHALSPQPPYPSDGETGLPAQPVVQTEGTSPLSAPHPSASRTGPVRQADPKQQTPHYPPTKNQRSQQHNAQGSTFQPNPTVQELPAPLRWTSSQRPRRESTSRTRDYRIGDLPDAV